MRGNVESAKALEWRHRFERYRSGETTIATFCERENVSMASFYYWRRALGPVSNRHEVAADRPRDFTPVRLVGPATVSVHLPGGTRLEIPLADADVFERALETLLRADARCAETQRGGAAC